MMEGDPFSFYYGVQWKERMMLDPLNKRKWAKPLFKSRGHKQCPYFQPEKFWPYVLCDQMMAIPRIEHQLTEIARAIPKIADVWYSTKAGWRLSQNSMRAQMLDPRNTQKRANMQKMLKNKVCNRPKYPPVMCVGADGTVGLEQKNSPRCGVWTKEFQLLKTSKSKSGRKIHYKVSGVHVG